MAIWLIGMQLYFLQAFFLLPRKRVAARFGMQLYYSLTLDYLSARLARQGWKIERRPASRCPWIVRVVLLMRRGKLQLPLPSNGWRLKLPTRRDWRDLAMMHHAVLSPPSYPSVEITPSAARLLRD